ncbi:7080_t:CDS:2 [Ambispora leptoticha]|uniref:7080_t:CDS:1 n=1 Tax=Ambispora leptoticha TaxID=144679 RepID=A0A9N9AWB8_9GLOM|nr:7080_t:CDS:2 [Ambispora leptoticha]
MYTEFTKKFRCGDRGCNYAEALMRPGIGGEMLPLYPILGYVGDAVALRGQALAFFMRPGIGGEALPLYLGDAVTLCGQALAVKSRVSGYPSYLLVVMPLSNMLEKQEKCDAINREGVRGS